MQKLVIPIGFTYKIYSIFILSVSTATTQEGILSHPNNGIAHGDSFFSSLGPILFYILFIRENKILGKKQEYVTHLLKPCNGLIFPLK